MEYAWAFADKRAEKGDHTRMARMLPSMTEDERSDARKAAGQMPRKAIESVNCDRKVNGPTNIFFIFVKVSQSESSTATINRT